MPCRRSRTPGSDEALSIGCRCPQLPNNYGRQPVYGADLWLITDGCPVHAPRAA